LNITKEILNLLSVNYKGTKDVQLGKVATLMRHYKSFCMKEGEFMADMFGRLQVLQSGHEALGHTFTKAQINFKY